ncbi:hypothetical protein AV521_15370 [Streptomyces sp. IMTB 2501]|nr:hypothetical protein AV521_15370 [Streptomyces sp. IMTB 2501]
MSHANAPLSVEVRRRLVVRCKSRPIAHVAAETGISRACASKWVNRCRRHGELGLLCRSSAPRRRQTATDADIVTRICHGVAASARTLAEQAPLHRPERRIEPGAAEDHRPPSRARGPHRCEEGGTSGPPASSCSAGSPTASGTARLGPPPAARDAAPGTIGIGRQMRPGRSGRTSAAEEQPPQSVPAVRRPRSYRATHTTCIMDMPY